ncbi:unnamed protein product [Caenorhabditis nigoni]
MKVKDCGMFFFLKYQSVPEQNNVTIVPRPNKCNWPRTEISRFSINFRFRIWNGLLRKISIRDGNEGSYSSTQPQQMQLATK